MVDSVGGRKFAQNKSKNSCNLKMIGNYWFLEVGGKLKRLNFLNDIYNVRMDENVIFADESVYQVEIDSNDVIRIIKIEDLYQGSDQLKPVDHDAGHGLNGEASDTKLRATNTDKELDIGNTDIGSTNDSGDCVIDESLYPDCTDEIHEIGHEEYVSEDDESDKVEKYKIGADGYMQLPNKFVKPVTMRAICEFKARLYDEITFTKGDKLTVDADELCKGHIWILASHHTSGMIGYIPSSFIVKDDNSPRSQEWWFNLNKEDTETLLLSPCYQPGTFLIRDSSDNSSLVLSVKDRIPETTEECIYHYRIIRSEHGQFFIDATRRFPNISDLISFYRKSASVLRLVEQCPKEAPTVPFKDLEISRQAVTILTELHHMPMISLWKVYIGNWLDKEVAVKSLQSGQMTATFMTEINVLRHLRHDKVVELLAVHTKKEPFLITTELLINGPLLNYLRADGGETLQLKELTNMACQIADGMHYLEKMHLVHRDLRAFNILVGRKIEVKIAEFGLARWIQNENGIYKATNAKKVPMKWTSPEALFELKFSTKSDVWSFGILLYEIITFGGMPYKGMTGKEAAERIRYGFRMAKPVTGPLTCPEPYYEVMLRCWDTVEVSRPTFAYLREYFRDYTSSAGSVYITRL